MPSTASPSPSAQEDHLDSEIASLRRELRSLTRHKRALASSLLTSSSLQKRLKAHADSAKPTPLTSLDAPDISPLVQAAGTHARTNAHRIAFSATTFPFKDPAPVHQSDPSQPQKESNGNDNANADRNLLGLRIDICARDGRFAKPYYVLLKRVNSSSSNKKLKIHRHTIPAFIDTARLERIYLPLDRNTNPNLKTQTEEPSSSPKQQQQQRQNLHGFVRELRRHLSSWHLRIDAISLLREEIGIEQHQQTDVYDSSYDDGIWERSDFSALFTGSTPQEKYGENEQGGKGKEITRLKDNEMGIVALGPTALDATYVRMAWRDGRVGRFKISGEGRVERAVVIGDEGRDKRVEAVLMGRDGDGDGKVEGVVRRLRGYSATTSTSAGHMDVDVDVEMEE